MINYLKCRTKYKILQQEQCMSAKYNNTINAAEVHARYGNKNIYGSIHWAYYCIHFKYCMLSSRVSSHGEYIDLVLCCTLQRRACCDKLHLGFWSCLSPLASVPAWCPSMLRRALHYCYPLHHACMHQASLGGTATAAATRLCLAASNSALSTPITT